MPLKDVGTEGSIGVDGVSVAVPEVEDVEGWLERVVVADELPADCKVVGPVWFNAGVDVAPAAVLEGAVTGSDPSNSTVEAVNGASLQLPTNLQVPGTGVDLSVCPIWVTKEVLHLHVPQCLRGIRKRGRVGSIFCLSRVTIQVLLCSMVNLAASFCEARATETTYVFTRIWLRRHSGVPCASCLQAKSTKGRVTSVLRTEGTDAGAVTCAVATNRKVASGCIRPEGFFVYSTVFYKEMLVTVHPTIREKYKVCGCKYSVKHQSKFERVRKEH
eukprot:g4421.t1